LKDIEGSREAGWNGKKIVGGICCSPMVRSEGGETTLYRRTTEKRHQKRQKEAEKTRGLQGWPTA
jgi:hypothetical protein